MDRFSLPSRLAILHLLTRLTTLILTHLILTLTLYLYTAPNFSHPTPLLYVPLIWCLAADTAEILALITRSEDGVPRAPTWAMVVGETLAVGLCSVSWVVSPSASFTPMGEQKWIGRLWVGVACLVGLRGVIIGIMTVDEARVRRRAREIRFGARRRGWGRGVMGIVRETGR